MADLQIGIIGSGGRGIALGENAHRPGRGVRIVACCDLSPSVLSGNRRSYGPDVFITSDHRELLERDLDAVIISTPDFLHEEHAVAALARGFAVFLEKPMAISIAGCDRILAQAVKSNARLYLGHNMRHMAFVQKMKALIDDGAIGEVKACWTRHFVGNGGDYYYRDWHAERRYTHGLLLQKAAHDFDVMHWLCGSYTRRVSAMGGLTVYGQVRNRLPATRRPRTQLRPQVRIDIWPPLTQRELNSRIDVEDLSHVNMELENGVFALYAQCHYTPDYWRSYVVIGTEGRIENFGDTGPGTCVKLWNKRKDGYDGRGDKVFQMPIPQGSHGGADTAIMAEFVRFARYGGATQTSPIAARESVATGFVATESLRSGGKPMLVPQLAPQIKKGFERLSLGGSAAKARP